MRHERAAAMLDDYLSGDLDRAQIRDLEAHLTACAACRQEAEQLRALLAATAELPRDLPPARDLWQGIAPRLAPRPELRAPRAGYRASRRLPAWRPVFAAAAVLALAVLSVATLRTGGGPEALPRAPAGVASGPAGLPMDAALALECAGPAAAVNLIDDDLKIVDLAIEELARAWTADPDDPDLSRRLASAYRTRANLLATGEALVWRL